MNWPMLKTLCRRCAISLCRGLLALYSRPYRVLESTAMILAPHPDDETLGCGALIARKRNEGHAVHIAFITDGGASHLGHPRYSAEEMVALRRQEARTALAELGMDPACIHHLDEPDGSLKELDGRRSGLLVARLAELMHTIRPTRIFVPCCPDGSSEHDPMLGLARQAANRARIFPELWQYPVWTWWNPALLFDKILELGHVYRLAGEDYRAIKQRALACYRTQVEPLPPWSDAAIPRELIDFCLRDPEYFFCTPARPRDERLRVI